MGAERKGKVRKSPRRMRSLQRGLGRGVERSRPSEVVPGIAGQVSLGDKAKS